MDSPCGSCDTPVSEWQFDLNHLAMAPKKQRGHICLTKFLHENKNIVADEILLESSIVVGYKFNKETRTVILYNTEKKGEYTPGLDSRIVFGDKDWTLFYNNVWKDLQDCREEPLYIAQWDAITPKGRYRVVGDHSKKRPGDCIYFFFCKDNTKLREPLVGVLRDEHYSLYEMQFLFKWRDLRGMENIFSTINKMFKWCDMHDGYCKVKVQLFHPEKCSRGQYSVGPSPPINYAHSLRPL